MTMTDEDVKEFEASLPQELRGVVTPEWLSAVAEQVGKAAAQGGIVELEEAISSFERLAAKGGDVAPGLTFAARLLRMRVQAIGEGK